MARRTLSGRPDDSPGADGRAVLADVLAVKGPLAVSSALMMVLHLCADASALDPSTLARSIGSLTTSHISRDPEGQWRWRPAPGGTLDRRPTDNEIAGRVGAVLFECLTATALADYLPDAAAVRGRLRADRPDLAQALVDLTARLAAARNGGRITLEAVATDIRHALGVGGATRTGASRNQLRVGVTIAAVTLALGLWLASPSGEARVESHGLTREELRLDDVAVDAADFWVVSREFITAFNHLEGLDRLWRARLPADDPRLARLQLREAWARVARGDFVTAEQALDRIVEPLERGLGEAHPYVRATRLQLGSLLERRGAVDLARAQRRRAEQATRALLPEATVSRLGSLAGPPAPGILAHLAPNAAEREWFRRRDDGSFFAPLTATARWLSERSGWRLHVAATGTCNASIDVGRDARRVQLSVVRVEEGWRLRVSGTRPAIDLPAAGTDRHLPITLAAAPDGTVRVWTPGAAPRVAALDPDSTPAPPYGLTFVSPQSDDGCALVWWEIVADS